MKKIFALILAVIMVCAVLAGCGGNGTGTETSSVLSEVSSISSDTSSVADNSSKTSSTVSIGTGGIFFAPEIKELPSIWTTARPTINWTVLKSGVTAHVVIEANGETYIDKSGITGTSYTLEKDLKTGVTYTVKVFYTRDGKDYSMAGITKNGKKIPCVIKKAAVTMSSIVTKIKNSSDYQIMMVGDSITYGTGSGDNYKTSSAPNDEKTYTAVFARLLGQKLTDKTVVRYDGIYDSGKKNANGFTYIHTYNGPVTVQTGTKGKITVVRSGIGGNTVARLIGRSDDFLGNVINNKKADLIIIKSGINDALNHTDTDGQKYVSPDAFKANLNTLLTKVYAENPDADVILMTPTVNDDHTQEKWQGKSQLDPYAERMKAVASEWGVPVIDLHKLWMDHVDKNAANYGSGDWLTDKEGDLCHPSPKGHEAIANEMIRALFN